MQKSYLSTRTLLQSIKCQDISSKCLIHLKKKLFAKKKRLTFQSSFSKSGAPTNSIKGLLPNATITTTFRSGQHGEQEKRLGVTVQENQKCPRFSVSTRTTLQLFGQRPYSIYLFKKNKIKERKLSLWFSSLKSDNPVLRYYFAGDRAFLYTEKMSGQSSF